MCIEETECLKRRWESRLESYRRSLPLQPNEDWKCSRRLLPIHRLRFWQDLSSGIRGSLCSSERPPPGSLARCGPFCTEHCGSHEKWGDRQGRESIPRARSQRMRKSFPSPAGRQAEGAPATQSRAPSVDVRRSPSSGGETPHKSSLQSDCRSNRYTNREVCANADPLDYLACPKSNRS